MIDVVISFLCGAVVTIVTLLVIVGFWFHSLPVVARSDRTITSRTYTRPLFPDHLEGVYARLGSASEIPVDESCVWFNLIVDFLFRELRDTPKMKRLVMKKVEKEFQELLFTKTEGRMLEQLTVREYFLGTSMPVIKSAEVVRVEYSTDEVKNLEVKLRQIKYQLKKSLCGTVITEDGLINNDPSLDRLYPTELSCAIPIGLNFPACYVKVADLEECPTLEPELKNFILVPNKDEVFIIWDWKWSDHSNTLIPMNDENDPDEVTVIPETPPESDNDSDVNDEGTEEASPEEIEHKVTL